MRCPVGHNGMRKPPPTKADRKRVGVLWGKKRYWHSTYGLIEVTERLFRHGSCLQRPFSATAGVRCRGVSAPLQRVVTDFGVDHPFRQVSEKLQEHYGITLPPETVRQTTERHGRLMLDNTVLETARPESPGKACVLCFGIQGTYLVDFYHLSEYLAEAAPSCSPDTAAGLEQQQEELKANRSAKVL